MSEIDEKMIKPDFFVSGKIGSGKDTIADFLKSYFGYYKFRIADTIKRIITERRNVSFEELEELKRSNPEIRDEHTDIGDWLGASSNLNRVNLLVNKTALDWTNLDTDKNFVVCDVRSLDEAEILLDNDVYGIFLSRTTQEYSKTEHWTEQNIFINGVIYELIKKYGDRCILVLNGGDYDMEKIKESIDFNIGEPHIITFDTEPNSTELLEKIDLIVTELIEKEN